MDTDEKGPSARAMARNSWHILREQGGLTLVRRLPVRFDLAVETRLPLASKLRIAQQVRQDMWRELRGLRGFSPAVTVREDNAELLVIAGGQVDGPWPADAEARIAALLASRSHRDRWLRWAA